MPNHWFVFSNKFCSVLSCYGYIPAAGIVVSISVCRLILLSISHIEYTFQAYIAGLNQICAQSTGAICCTHCFQNSVISLKVQTIFTYAISGFPVSDNVLLKIQRNWKKERFEKRRIISPVGMKTQWEKVKE